MGQDVSTAGGGGIKQRKGRTSLDTLDKVLALDAEITQIPECKLIRLNHCSRTETSA